MSFKCLMFIQSIVLCVLVIGEVYIKNKQIVWDVHDTEYDCEVIQTFGFAIKVCENKQEVRSTTDGN